MAGERVRTLTARLETGKAMWDMRSSSGNPCSAGVFVAIVEAQGDDGHTQMKKVKLAIARPLNNN